MDRTKVNFFNSYIFNSTWIAYFGGHGREQILLEMVNHGIKISKCFVPRDSSKELRKSIEIVGTIIEDIEEITPDLLDKTSDKFQSCNMISVGFPFVFPTEVLHKFAVAINVHPSLLPRYRGPHPFAYILENNEQVTGSTVHFMTTEVDSGPIILQNEIQLTAFDTYRSVRRKTFAAEPKLVMQALDILSKSNLFRQQDAGSDFLYARRRTPLDSELDANLPLSSLVNKIRACDPEDFPAFFWLEGKKIYVYLSSKNKIDEDML